MTEPGDLARQLAHALTGEWLPAGQPLRVSDVPAELAARGWDAQALRDLRIRRQQEGLPWPFPADLDALREIGFARFDAQLTELRGALGLDGLVPEIVADRPWTKEERHLAADRPPHWG